MLSESRANVADIGLLIETSWEVCNKIGGIYTVLSTKAKVLNEQFGDKLVFIGPDVYPEGETNPYFKENKRLLKGFASKTVMPYGIKARTGRWDIPGSPQVVLIKFDGMYEELNRIFGEMWEKFGVNSMHEYGDYREGCAFSTAVAITCDFLSSFLGIGDDKVTVHFNEWTTGMGLLYLRKYNPGMASIFTTHATSIGRSICGNGKPLYDYFEGYNGDQMAEELNMEAKHSLEKRAAWNADCFTAVSEVTAKECRQLLGKYPDVVTPNGFEPGFVPGEKRYAQLHKNGREKILKTASLLKNKELGDNTFIIATSGRNEYRNKGIDIFLDSLRMLEKKNPARDVLALILVPAWVKEPSESLVKSMEKGEKKPIEPDYLTHRLNNEDTDAIACRVRALQTTGEIGEKVNVVYVPCYLNGGDGIVNISYYDLLPAIDLSVFPSYYEPWGYTPLESIAFGVPTITSDKSGFGQWVLGEFINSIDACGVKVIGRTDSNYMDFAEETAGQIAECLDQTEEEAGKVKEKASATAEKADWKYFIKYYDEAFGIADANRKARLS